MRVLVVDPYRRDVFERDIPKTLKGSRTSSMAASKMSPGFPMGISCTSTRTRSANAYFALGKGEALPEFGVVVGSSGPEGEAETNVVA